ncbi:MAG: hypothetical protein LBM87_04805 [Ruminococcus sp.]|jgi:aromatic ring-opening dioxygenase catalytic subunit (LigB family)|nr:hypothetical protein [Ruminococcus sp.]
MFTEFGWTYGVFLFMAIIAPAADIIVAAIMILTKREIMKDFVRVGIKLPRIICELFFVFALGFFIESLTMSKEMTVYHWLALSLLLCDAIVGSVLKYIYRRKKPRG